MTESMQPWRADFDLITTLDESFTQELWDLKFGVGTGWAWGGDHRVEGDPDAPSVAEELAAMADREIDARVERIEALMADHPDRPGIEAAWDDWCQELRERCRPRRHRR